MKIKRYLGGALAAVGLAISCAPDPIPTALPANSSNIGSFLRAYQVASNTWDLDDLANSGFQVVYESVDNAYGADLYKIEFYATHRKGSTGQITDEILVKTIDVATIATLFKKVPQPSFSPYLRSSPITVTEAETVAALSILTTDPDGTTCSGIFPDVCSMVAYPGSLAVGDRIIFRIAITDKLGRYFTVANPQTTVTPSLGNPDEANITTNLSGGLFFANPMIFTVLIQRTTTTGNPLAYTGDYLMKQASRWQPDHSVAQHQEVSKDWIDKFAFGDAATSTDSSQVVTLAKVPGGLPTQRSFTCKYRGTNITMVINLEMAVLNETGAGFPGTPPPAALVTMTDPATGVNPGMGFPAGTTNANLGTVFLPLMNSTVDCTSIREFYLVTPTGGSFPGIAALPPGMPRRATPNRGSYRIDRDGLTAGDVFSLAVDDDCDEYGRRNGYCNWYTRIMLTMTKL